MSSKAHPLPMASHSLPREVEFFKTQNSFANGEWDLHGGKGPRRPFMSPVLLYVA